ncbi:g3528 [Coccomyxa elongata]
MFTTLKLLYGPRYLVSMPLPSFCIGVQAQRKVVHNGTVDEQQHQAVHDGHHHIREHVHWWWTSAVKPGLLAGLLLAVSLLMTPMAHARRGKRVQAPQVAQVQNSGSNKWRSNAESVGMQARQRLLVPAAASLRATGRSIQDAAEKAATATDNRVVKPIVHQAQSAAAETRHFFTHLGDHQSSKNGRSSRSAPGPSSQAGFTIEDHLRDSLQSPAVRIVVTVGAVSVLLLILRTSMEDPIIKKFSPLDSDDWMDREDGENGDEEGGRGDVEYPRGSAAFSGAAAEDAAVLAARASAIVDKGVQAQRGRPTTSRNSAAHNGSTPLEIIAPGSQVPPQGEGARPSESNKKLRAQLEEVRRTVADAKAQVKAATTAGPIQTPSSTPDTGRNKSSITAEQKQLPVFKAAELQGTPAEYQKKASTYQSEVQKSTIREAKPVLRYETQNGTPVDTKPRGQQQQAKRASFRPPQPLPAADSESQQALPAGSKSQQALPLEAEQKALPSPATSVRREVEHDRAVAKVKRTAAESEEYLRSRGGGAPLVLALGFLSATASALSPLVMSKEERQRRAVNAQQRREAWRAQAGAQAELDWERYGKYDMLHELLQAATSEPSLQDERYTPVRALVDAVPAKGAQRYDFLRQLLKGMTSPEPAAAKYDPVWDLLHAANTKGVPEASGTRFDPIYKFLNRAAAAADWGLPEEGPVAALLAANCADWEPPRYCPVFDALKSAKTGGAAPWHNNIRPKWDPLVALLSAQAPEGSSKYDPVKAAIAVDAPAGQAQDPFGTLLDFFKRKPSSAKGSGTPALPTGQSNPLADAIAQEHAVPAAAAGDLSKSPAVPTEQKNPLLDAIAEQHALPQTEAKTSGAGVVSQLTEADLAERTGGAQPAGVQSGWLTSWFRKGTQAPQQAAPSGSPDSSSNSSQPGAGTVSRRGHSLTTSFGPRKGSSTGATTPLANLAQERTQPLADALRNAPAATARARESGYDPLPDLRRLRRGTGTPLMAQRDVPGHIDIMLRRDADFDRIVAAFREVAEDEYLAREFNPLYTLMRNAAARAAPAFPADSNQSILQGMDKAAVEEAQASVKAFLQYLDLPKYAPLQRLLRGRRSADVVETACALAIIVQPAHSESNERAIVQPFSNIALPA